MADLTVLLPTLGERADTLARAVASVAAQTRPCDLIVSHDTERIGAAAMLNRMVAGVQTPWVHTLGDDDTLLPDFAALVEEQSDWQADLIVFQMAYEDGRVLPITTNPDALCVGAVGCSYVVRTEVARRVRWVDGPEDWNMVSAVRDIGTVRIVPEIVYRVRH